MNIYKKILNVVAKVFNMYETSSYYPDNTPSFGAGMISVFIIMWFLCRFAFGVAMANDPEYCRIKSIGDFLIAPSYTIGCNIGKDRFNIKVN